MKPIRKIEIWSRGKNRDEFGNPYYAFIAVIQFQYVSYFNTITIAKSMSYGSSGEWDCLLWALQGINEALGTDIKPDDQRITHHYKHVYRERDLEHPELWK